jgi:hypothetical protein
MITAVTVENFRGIERCEVSNLGRVNLFTGKNNCGKTALLESIYLARDPRNAAHSIAGLQEVRRVTEPIQDLDGFWRLLFRTGDAERGFLVGSLEYGERIELRGYKESSETVISASDEVGSVTATQWQLVFESRSGATMNRSTVTGVAGAVRYSEPLIDRAVYWVAGRPLHSVVDIRLFSALKQAQREDEVIALLRLLDDSVRGIEILAPTGNRAALFLRVAGSGLMLPFSSMGEGVQRCFEIANGIAAGRRAIFIDEFENGLHHSTLEPLWRWIATVSAQRNIQVFATTHSEECVQAAARAFTALNYEELRVIRLDRHEHHTSAAVYDRNLVEAAERMGIEIRG